MSMRLGIVAEFSDRATKRMAKLLRANRKLEKANKAQTKLAKTNAAQTKAQAGAQGKLANNVARTNRLMAITKAVASGIAAKVSSATAAMGRFAGSIASAIRKTMTLEASLSRVRRGLRMMKDGAGKIARGLTVATGLALGAVALAGTSANTVIGPAAQMEKYQTILETTTGSAAKAKQAMAWVTDFAVKTPYELNDVMASFVQLRNYGLDPTNGMLKSLGDTSAAMGKPIMQAVEAMADAVTGENERLKEFGIKARKAGKYFYYEYTQNGVTKVAKALASDRAAIQKTLTGIFDAKYSGAMDKLSKTWEGMISNLSDMWFKFRLMIADSGVFDWAKDKVRGFLDLLNQMEANGSLQKVAKEIGANIISTLEAAWTFAQGLWEIMKELGGWLKYAADALGGWNRLAAVFVALPLLGTLAGIVTGFAQLAGGLALIFSGITAIVPMLAGIGAAIMAISWPVVAVVAAVAAVAASAYLIYDNWDAVSAWFAGLWDQIVNVASAAWDWLKENLSWHPLVMIVENWAPITDWLANFWTNLKSLAQSGWNGLKSLFDFNWPELPALELPSLETLQETLTSFFSLDWLPDWTWPEIPMPDLPDLGGMIDGMVDKAGAAWNRISSIFSDYDPITIAARDPASIERATKAANQLKGALDGVSNVDVSPALAKMDAVQSKANQLPSITQSAMDRVRAVLASTDFTYQGQRMMETIAAGMRSRAQVLVNEMRQITQQLRDHLPSSPAKVGPLSDIHRLKFGETIAQSIRPAPMVKAMRKAALATIVAATITSPSRSKAVASPIMPALTSRGLQASNPSVLAPSQSAMSAVSPMQASAPAGASQVHITFAPTVTVGAGSSVSEGDLMALLEEQADELVALLERKLAEKQRLEFL